MNTVQEPLTSAAFNPPSFPSDNFPEQVRTKEPTNNFTTNPVGPSADQLPDRCQFFFSDGRQCRMARSEIHPSRCPFHAEREDQLFGDPSPGGYVVGAALDLPELYSACRDLSTAAGVNRALGQVFRLLAQRRISRQEAATFGHLAQLLLRSISAMRQESLTIPLGSSGSAAKGYPLAGESPAANAYLSSRESHGDQESRSPGIPEEVAGLSRVNEVHAAPAPNSQLSQNEQMCGTRLQLAQNEHLPDCST